MPMTFASLGLDGLSVDQKLEVIGELWDDLTASVPPSELLTDAQRAELRRRIADAEANPGDDVPWEEVLAATLKRLSG